MSSACRQLGLDGQARGRKAERRVFEAARRCIRRLGSAATVRYATPAEDRAGIDLVVTEGKCRSRRVRRRVLLQVKASKSRPRLAYYAERGIAVVVVGTKDDETLDAEVMGIVVGVL